MILSKYLPLAAALSISSLVSAAASAQCHTLSNNEAANYLANAGFIGWEIDRMIDIAHCESSLYSCAYNGSNYDGSIDMGWLQINSIHGYGEELYNPQTSAHAAFGIFADAGYNFSPWVCSGEYAY